MSKFQTHVVRRDAKPPDANHVHALPDGHMTEGMLEKPMRKYFHWHTHLYQFEGKTYETEPAEDGPGHVHCTEMGDTSGPVKAEKAPGQPWREDSMAEAFKGKVQRRGSLWFAISYDGQVLGSRTRQDAAQGILEAWEKEDAALRRA